MCKATAFICVLMLCLQQLYRVRIESKEIMNPLPIGLVQAVSTCTVFFLLYETEALLWSAGPRLALSAHLAEVQELARWRHRNRRWYLG